MIDDELIEKMERAMSDTPCPWCGAYSPRSCELRDEMTGDICPWEESGEYELDPDRLREERDERRRLAKDETP
jgi:hypothetical protein